MYFEWPEKIIMGAVALFIVAVTVGLIYGTYNQGVYRDKCLVAGGIPIIERNLYCVKPNSFIEVNI